MSFFPGKDPQAGDAHSCEAIAHVVVPRTVDLGDGFSVRRALPSAQTRMVGPFIFFDHFGPAEFRAGNGLDVRPHPHIGLATVTYLFDGEIMHRDSLGTAVAIRPGEVNWMTAGRGIVHSERTGPEKRAAGGPIHGLQMWVALPAAKEEMDAGFAHHDIEEFPMVRDEGKLRARRGRLALRRTSRRCRRSTKPCSPTRCCAPARALPLDADHEERALYVVDGTIDIAGDKFEPGRLLVFKPGDRITITAVDRRAFRHLRRRADGRPAPHLVEFRLVAQRAHRAGQGRMEGRPFRQGAGRRDRVHSAAGEVTRSASSRARRCAALTDAA